MSQIGPPAAEHDHWKNYEDLLSLEWTPEDERDPEEKLLAVHGCRVVLCVDDDGNTQLRWDVTGEPAVHALLGMLQEVQFLYQLQEFAMHVADDEMERDDLDPDEDFS